MPVLAYSKSLLTGQAFGILEVIVWPTPLYLMANEKAQTSWEFWTNFGKAIFSNILLYVVVGAGLFGLRTVWQRLITKDRNIQIP